jgi:hypothetical protein
VTKKSERDNRRAIAEQMRKAQQRKERQRSLLILGACVLVVVALLGSAVFVYVKDNREKEKLAGQPVEKIGATTAAAECEPVKSVDATGSGQHIDPPKQITYQGAPPAFGPHWPNYLQGSELRSFYTRTDRPEIERLVHSLEHGHTIIWYDETVKPGSQAYKDIRAMAGKFDPETDKVMAAPWKASDGDSFPSGMHVAFTHWTGPQKQKGITEYCKAPSGAVLQKFIKDYPANSAPEPEAP